MGATLGNAALPSTSSADAVGHPALVDQSHSADSVPADPIAARDGGQLPIDTQVHNASIAPQYRAVIDEIIEQWRRRQAWHRAEKSLTLAAKAMCRRLTGADIKEADALYSAAIGKGEHPLASIAFAAIFPLIESRDGLEKRHRKPIEKRLAKLAKSLPVAPWVESVRGVGLGSLAAIVGESGDVGSYRNPSCLWKRMGLAVFDGQRQRKVADRDLAILMGYSPSRRSVMWNVGDCIVKAGGPLRELYDQRKAYEVAKNEAGDYAERAAQELKRIEAKAARKILESGRLTPAHIHNRSKRYIEKRFLKLLWQQWRKANGQGE